MPLVTVIVPTYGDTEGLSATLMALGSQTMPRRQFEVIVVDNNPSPQVSGALPAALLSGCRVIHERRPGSYAARNAGLEAARGRIFALTDADCRPAPDWLTEGKAAVGSTLDVVAGRVEVWPRDPIRMTPVEAYDVVRAFPQERYVSERGFGVTANLFVPREVIEQVGPFDDRLLSGGDREFGQRAGRAGFEVRYSPLVVVGHPARRTWRELSHKLRRVHAGSRDAALLGVGSDRRSRGFVRTWLPPLGSVKRALTDRRLPNPRAKAGYALAEVYVRYAGLWIARARAAAQDSPR